MDLFRAPHLNAHDYLVRISEIASGLSGNGGRTNMSDGNPGNGDHAKRSNSIEKPFFHAKGEPLSAEVLYLKLHLLETLTKELLPQGETLAQPQIPQTLDRVWLRADHQLSHVPYFWRFALDWLEPAGAPIPSGVPHSGMEYCLNALALIWQSVLEFDENQWRQKREDYTPDAGEPEAEDASKTATVNADFSLPKTAWEKKIFREALQIGNALSQAAQREISANPADFLTPVGTLKNRLWERIFHQAPSPAQPEAFPTELQAALHRIADRWEENLREESSTPEATGSVEEALSAEEESIQVDDDEDDEFITETIVMSAPEDTARLEMEDKPKAAPDESASPSEPEDSLAETVAFRKDSDKPEESEKSPSEDVPETAQAEEEALAETVVLKNGRGTKTEAPPPPTHSPDSPPNAEPGLAETVVLRGNAPKKNGPSHAPPPPTDSPESPNEEVDDLAATVVVRPGKKASPRRDAGDTEPTAPETGEESPDSLTETVILRPGRGRGRERS